MINQIGGIHNPYQTDNSATQNTANNPQIADIKSGRNIEDKIDLSLEARETLEERNKARQAEQDRLTDEILSKGFRGWAEEYHKEKLEAEVRAEVLRSFGLDEDGFSKLESEVQQRIQEIIKAKAREKMEQQMAEELEKNKTNSTTEL